MTDTADDLGGFGTRADLTFSLLMAQRISNLLEEASVTAKALGTKMHVSQVISGVLAESENLPGQELTREEFASLYDSVTAVQQAVGVLAEDRQARTRQDVLTPDDAEMFAADWSSMFPKGCLDGE